MRRLGKVFSFVLFDFIDSAEQLNFSEVILQVVGNSSFVRGAIVQTLDIQEFLSGQDSVNDRFPVLAIVKLWRRGSVMELTEAFMD